jgi:hypothetical protein
MRKYILAALVLLAVWAGGCAGRLSGDDAELIRQLIDAQVTAVNHNDLPAYMATLDPASPAYGNTEAELKKLIEICTTESKIISFEFVTSTSREAQVRTLQETRLVDPGPKGLRFTLLHTVRKCADGKWKMYNSIMEKDEEFE